ncbi:hypothetical protein [Dictyobacter aurantiacus]|uniref:DinB-like domain-containing protein n=1 Tax=Dictyobacter aurantiacus TaxID=1936993 RepID=A0A401ZPR6_9CHLR|nr:hypothetical protein [Dictyobacter aurantiacus]GCE08865.1 hypothetical protein KDAU_61940 [Dictyobacter aurantiacus]
MRNDSEAMQIARMLANIGQRTLYSCEALPDDLLQYAPPFSEIGSPLATAIDLARDIEKWVLIPVGGRQPLLNQSLEMKPICSLLALSRCYGQWMKSVHTILDNMPDSFMCLLVEARSLQGKMRGRQRPTVRACLLTAVERSAYHLGRIETICQMVSQNNMPLSSANLVHLRGIHHTTVSIQ